MMPNEQDARDLAAVIEPIAFNAWPAPEVELLGGWRMRFADGHSGRGNSVATFGTPPGALPEAVAHAVEAYRRRGLRPLFQTTPADQPNGLDKYLADNGWQALKPVHVMTARAMPADPSGIANVEISSQMSEAWAHVFDAGAANAGDARERRGMIERIGPRGILSLALDREGRPAAIGLGVAEAGYGGIFCMRTIASARRRGLASLMLKALSHALHAKGAQTLYLQVEQDNRGAIALYERAGFQTAYDYRYRAAPDNCATRPL